MQQSPKPSSRIPLILGAGLIGHAGTDEKVSDPTVVQEFVDIMVRHGQVGIDTSRIYCKGTSEQLLGDLDFRGAARVDTKIFPLPPGGHKPETVKATFKASAEALKGKNIRVYYLHKPDHTVPWEDTLQAVDELYRSGGFEEFGLSNFTSWEVAEVVTICKLRGFVQPTAYQGVYNILDRMNEDELFPCLRKHGIKFAAYSVLAGGYLSDRFFVPSEAAEKAAALRSYSPSNALSWFYTSRYYPMAPYLAELAKVVKAHGLTLNEVSYRWLLWHSKMQPSDLGIIVAASKTEQLENTIADTQKGPLPEEVVKACEDLWKEGKGSATKYWLDD